MSINLKINNERFTFLERHIHRACKKLEKYALMRPDVDCKILTFRKGISVKISLTSKNKHFSGEAKGMQMNVCINKAVQRLIRRIEARKYPFKSHHDKQLATESLNWLPS